MPDPAAYWDTVETSWESDGTFQVAFYAHVPPTTPLGWLADEIIGATREYGDVVVNIREGTGAPGMDEPDSLGTIVIRGLAKLPPPDVFRAAIDAVLPASAAAFRRGSTEAHDFTSALRTARPS